MERQIREEKEVGRKEDREQRGRMGNIPHTRSGEILISHMVLLECLR